METNLPFKDGEEGRNRNTHTYTHTHQPLAERQKDIKIIAIKDVAIF